MQPAPTRRFRFSLLTLLIVVTIVGILFALVWPAVLAARAAARRMQEANHFKQVGLALHNYYSANDTFPPATIPDAQGKPFRSWRVCISPFLESSDFYHQYQHDEPWDSAANSRLCERYRFGMFFAPDQPPSSHFTNMVMITGPGTMGEEARSFDDVADDPGETIMLLALKPSDILWHEPRDLSINEVTRAPGNPQRILMQGKLFPGGACTFVDGSVAWLPADLEYDTLHAMLTISGGEKVDMSWK
jgi:hypothetical protein